MKNPCVKVEVLDKDIPKVAQKIYDRCMRMGWQGNIEEIELLRDFLQQCEVTFHPIAHYYKNSNVQYGFEDMTEWEKKYPGNTEYTCEFCGIYRASKPHCNKCES